MTDGAARSPRPWSDLDGDRPISRAWTRDTISELLTGRRFVRTKSRRKTDLILKLSVAATILIGLVLFQILQRKYNDAEAMIAANRVPLDELVVPMSTSDEPVVEITDHSANEVPPNQLADADPQRPDEFQAPAVETAPILKSSPPTRFGFDLDHGTPMPPDSATPSPCTKPVIQCFAANLSICRELSRMRILIAVASGFSCRISAVSEYHATHVICLGLSPDSEATGRLADARMLARAGGCTCGLVPAPIPAESRC